VQRYARGVALAALGRVEEAEAEKALFLAARAKVPESRKHLIYNTYADVLGQCCAWNCPPPSPANECVDDSVALKSCVAVLTGVAESMLEGEIAYRKGDFETAFAKLREAVRKHLQIASLMNALGARIQHIPIDLVLNCCSRLSVYWTVGHR